MIASPRPATDTCIVAFKEWAVICPRLAVLVPVLSDSDHRAGSAANRRALLATGTRATHD